MKNKFSTILFLLAIAFTANSKPIESITGENPKDGSYIFVTVIDSEDNDTLPFVSVVAMVNDQQIDGVQTGINGKGTLKITADYLNKQLTILAVYPGYKDKKITFTLNSDNKNITLRMVTWSRPFIDYIIYVPPSPAYRTTGWDKQTIRKGDTPFW